MKKIIISIGPVLLTTLMFNACLPVVDVEQEKEAIMAVIEAEKDAYFERDITKVEAVWVQDSTSRKMYMTPEGLYYFNGWSEIYKHDKENTESDMWDDMEDIQVEFLNYEFNIYNNTALVFCNSRWNGMYKGEPLDMDQKRILHFVKVDGSWKYDLMAMYRIPEKSEPETPEEGEPETAE
jgi:hypothetical protein